MFDLTGKVALVTGASRGLGREDALTLARMGADVVITDVLIEDDPDLETTAQGSNSVLQDVARQQGWVFSNRTAEEIRKLGRRSVAIKMDVTNREQVADVFKRVKEEFGAIHILVNNAAVLDNTATIAKMDYKLWDRDIAVNLTGAFNCTKEAWPYLREQQWGRVIFMASIAGTLGGFGQASYSATKAAVIALAKTAALEGGKYNITANAIAPGIIGSESAKLAEQFRAEEYDRFREHTVFKRFGEPSQVAAAIAFLCTEEAGYITGTVLEVMGGMNLFTASLRA
ncbi:MAG TPA: SDR family NAD(P)-dependent oxidoreductase [Candidatus Dormibacteraeota bacterium]